MTQTAQMSKSFRFVDVIAFKVVGDSEEEWRASPPGPHPTFTQNKWVYIFQSRSTDIAPVRGVPTTFFGACFVDGAGSARRVDAKTARVDTDLQELANVPATSDVSLPDRLFNLPPLHRHEEQCFYYFWASPIQLSTRMIAHLEGTISRLVEPVDLPDAEGHVDGIPVVPVVDPLVVALHFAGSYEVAADDAFFQTTNAVDIPADRSASTRRRAARQPLAFAIKSILEADRENDLKISNREKVLTNVRTYLADERRVLAALEAIRDVAARRLVRWLESTYFQLVEAAHRDLELLVYDRLVSAMAGFVDRLIDSSVGKAFFARFPQRFAFMHDEYILRGSSTPDWKWGTVKKCGGAAISILTKLVPYLVAKNVAAGGRVIAAGVNFLARAELAIVSDFGPVALPIRKRGGVTVINANLKGIQVNTKVNLKEFQEWAKPGQRGTINVLTLLVEVANIAINTAAIFKSAKGRTKEQVLGTIKALGNLGSLAKAFDKLYSANKVRAARFACIAGAADIILGTVDGVDAFNEGDWWRFGGDMLLATAGGVGAFAALCEAGEVAAVGASVGGLIAFAAAIVAGIGGLIVNFLSDTDIDTFVKHSSFGDKPGSGDFVPKWSRTNVNTWADDAEGLARQLDALHRLSARFEFTAAAPARVKFTFNNLLPESLLRVSFRGEFAPPETLITPKIVIRPLDGTVVEREGMEHAKIALSPASVDSGLLVSFLELQLDLPVPPNQSAPPPAIQLLEVDVRLDLYGDGTSLLPEKPLHGWTYRTPAINQFVFSSVA
jgi:hypothetical protein